MLMQLLYEQAQERPEHTALVFGEANVVGVITHRAMVAAIMAIYTLRTEWSA